MEGSSYGVNRSDAFLNYYTLISNDPLEFAKVSIYKDHMYYLT